MCVCVGSLRHHTLRIINQPVLGPFPLSYLPFDKMMVRVVMGALCTKHLSMINPVTNTFVSPLPFCSSFFSYLRSPSFGYGCVPWFNLISCVPYFAFSGNRSHICNQINVHTAPRNQIFYCMPLPTLLLPPSPSSCFLLALPTILSAPQFPFFLYILFVVHHNSLGIGSITQNLN